MAWGYGRRKFGKWILLLCVFSCVVFGLIKCSYWLFSIDTIEVVGEHIDVRIDRKKFSNNLLFFPSERMRTSIVADSPWLSDVRFQKMFPHTLRIIPTIRTPMAVVVSAERTFLVDELGMILAEGIGDETLPVLYTSVSMGSVGQKLTDATILQDLEIIVAFRDIAAVQSLTEAKDDFVLVKIPETDIFIPHKRSVSATMATLQTLIAGFRIKGKLPTVVDLRFDKPIVKF